MTGVDEQVNEHDLETPDSIQVRFGIEYVESHPPKASAVLSIQMHRFRNPHTGAPTMGPLAILVDAAAGIVNHYRRRPGQWTVSSELSMDLSPDLGELDGPVLASAHSPGPLGATSLGVCTLTYRGSVIGTGTVRSFFIHAGDVVPQQRPETLQRSPQTALSDLMAVTVASDNADCVVLAQGVDQNLNNDIDIVHGGVAAAGLELAASAAINHDRSGGLLQTGSLRVNFLRPFFAGDESRYEGTQLRVGRQSAVGDAQAIGDDGKVAITARVTAYR
ncbi:phenylacetic acid degradation protein [Mycobacterium numidiamassiliense]|uniref:Phenylacetic acid degradation protein n=1 Tax=Mycobacterium numidiamassiliense TaxID=1841861 RepID=A0A2U3PAQ1_9MYCO|nr:PaaI family thioesterase [Mycobacterium numidiamassiliense]SPM40833.1 phenylacetic acid degradation protein [Mycobacterium numidiamassiliense]